MDCQAVIAADGKLNGTMGIQFAKMLSGEESPVMRQEEKKAGLEKACEEASILRGLIQRSREGDSQAMEAIYRHFKTSLFNLAYRYTYNTAVAEDLLQDIFLKIFTHIKDVREEETFVSWIYRIAINTCFSYLRGTKSQLKRTVPLDEVEGKIDEGTYESGDRMMKRSLDDAIQSLPGKLKTVFLLHDVQGFKHEEIAQIMDWSPGTSKSQLFKARMKIRERLEKRQVL